MLQCKEMDPDHAMQEHRGDHPPASRREPDQETRTQEDGDEQCKVKQARKIGTPHEQLEFAPAARALFHNACVIGVRTSCSIFPICPNVDDWRKSLPVNPNPYN